MVRSLVSWGSGGEFGGRAAGAWHPRRRSLGEQPAVLVLEHPQTILAPDGKLADSIRRHAPQAEVEQFLSVLLGGRSPRRIIQVGPGLRPVETGVLDFLKRTTLARMTPEALRNSTVNIGTVLVELV